MKNSPLEPTCTAPAGPDSVTAAAPETWDLILRPRTGWFDLHLADLWRYRDLISLFVWRDFVAQYKQTILGPLWFLLQPLMTTLIFTVIFGRIAKLSTDGLPQTLFYMSGTVAWTYFASCLNSTSNTFIANANLFGKVYFPRLCVPLSIVISNLVQFALQFCFLLCFFVYFLISGAHVRVTAVILLLPVLLLMMAGLGLGSGIIVSSLTTRYRDLRFLVTFGVQLAMYTTPVIMPLSMLNQSRWRWAVLANPMSPIIETFRYALFGHGTFNVFLLLYSAVATILLLLAGILLFNHVEKTFMDTV